MPQIFDNIEKQLLKALDEALGLSDSRSTSQDHYACA